MERTRTENMPGFTTHYLFGLNTYKQLSPIHLKKIIQKNHTVYSLGLQGPDIFFYYLPSYLVHENNIGSVAHISHTGKFLQNLLKSRCLFSEAEDLETAEAYIAGFLGHYILDARCHPYIYWRSHFKEKSADYHGMHMRLETDIDTELLRFYKHKNPSQFRQSVSIMLAPKQKRTIASILYYAYTRTYPDFHITYAAMNTAITAMQRGLNFLHDPSGRKKVVLRRLESILLGYPLLSCMIPSDCLTFYLDPLNILHRQWHNPWDKSLTSRDSFFDLMEDAQIEYADILTKLSDIFSDKAVKSNEKIRTLLKQLGNNSYHSGLSY